MIEVMLASRLTRDGVDGVRWVLLEETTAARNPAPAPAPAKLLAEAAASAVALPGRSLRSVLVQGALAWFTYGLGLLLAVWLAYHFLGAPEQPAPPPPVARPLLAPAAGPAARLPAAPVPAGVPVPMPAPAPAAATSTPSLSGNL